MSQYYLKVENSKVIKEDGHFFRAAPFTIFYEGVSIVCDFSRNAKKHVVYKLIENGTILAELEHQDYSPECEPENLKNYLLVSNGNPYPVIAALVHLGIAQDARYKALYINEGADKYSFEVKQESLM